MSSRLPRWLKIVGQAHRLPSWDWQPERLPYKVPIGCAIANQKLGRSFEGLRMTTVRRTDVVPGGLRAIPNRGPALQRLAAPG